MRLDDGTELAADLVVMAVGIRPECSLASAAGLETDRGILVNDLLQTSDRDIYALGECAQHRGVCYGLVAPLYEMADVLAGHLVNALPEQSGYQGSVTATRLKVTGIDLFSAGDFAEQGHVIARHAPALQPPPAANSGHLGRVRQAGLQQAQRLAHVAHAKHPDALLVVSPVQQPETAHATASPLSHEILSCPEQLNSSQSLARDRRC